MAYVTPRETEAAGARRAPEAAAPAPPPVRIAANILAADLACLGHEVAAAIRSGADRVHLDVMDLGSAASIAPLVCRALKRLTGAPLEVHLLVPPCDRLVAAFAGAGADLVVFHPEASADVRRTVAAVRRRGCAAGLALAAGTPLDALDGLLDGVDVVLATGAGEPRSPLALRWIQALRRRVSAARPGIALSAEGGVDVPSGAALAGAGVDELVVESFRCGASDRAANIAALRLALRDRGAPSLAAAGRRRAGDLAS